MRLTAITMLCSVIASPVLGADTIPYRDFLSQNAVNIQKLLLGMTKQQVMEIMGTTPSEVHDGIVTNPYETELLTACGKKYEVLHFLTRPHRRMQPLSKAQAIPVILEDNKLVGVNVTAMSAITVCGK